MSPRTVLDPYVRLFAVPGAASFSLAGWLGRLPASTTGLGTVLLISGETGSYTLAGAVSGTFALAYSVGSPLWARGIDRRGQSTVLRRSCTRADGGARTRGKSTAQGPRDCGTCWPGAAPPEMPRTTGGRVATVRVPPERPAGPSPHSPAARKRE